MKLNQLFEAMVYELYHTTTMKNAIKIMQDGQITPVSQELPDWKPAICLTRNQNMTYNGGSVKFIIDRQVLGHTQEIKPFDFLHSTATPEEIQRDYFDMVPGEHKEQEERVYKPIKMGPKVIKSVHLMPANCADEEQQLIPQFLELLKKHNLNLVLVKLPG